MSEPSLTPVHKRVHFSIYKPHNSLFKSNRNDKAEAFTIDCSNSDNCGLFARGECSFIRILSYVRCPYGSANTVFGYTRKASAYSSWIRTQEDANQGIGKLRHPTDKMAIVGEYVYLPYAHMTMNEQIPFTAHSSLFATGNCFLRRGYFTIDNILKLINYRPMALMGGEIKSYQSKVPPAFLKHLSETLPDVFAEVIKDPYAKKRYNEFTNIGRKAKLSTLKPNIGIFKDIHGGIWNWDGKYLSSNNSHASFVLVNKFKSMVIEPCNDEVVAITDENQVSETTVFVE
jgi:hypothetical protein